VVRVVGAVHTPASEIVSAAGLAGHPPLLDVDPGAAAARLDRLPWISSATVSRRWPDGVVVTVTERHPVAAAATGSRGGGWALVDRTGRVLADLAAPPAGLVHLVAPGSPGAPGSELGRAAAPGLQVAATLPQAFSAQVTEVQVARNGQVTLALTTPVTVELGTATQLHAKYEDVAATLAGAHLVAGDVVDVRVPDSPTVGPS
jgi:cell division protein FtsQ